MDQLNTPTSRNVRVAPSNLKALVCRIFVYNGLPGDHAEIAAHALVKASLRGVDSHGVARVPMYCVDVGPITERLNTAGGGTG